MTRIYTKNAPSYMLEIEDLVIKQLEKLNIQECSPSKLAKALDPIHAFIEECLIDKLRGKEMKALDVFNNTFIIQKVDYEHLLFNSGKIYDMMLKYPDNEIEDALLKSDLRFCVIYDGLDGKYKKDVPKIVDIPEDIFKFLINNKYDSDIIKAIIDKELSIKYNYVEALRKLIRIGVTFKQKNKIINDGEYEADLNVVEYIANKYSPVNELLLSSRFCKKYSEDKFDILTDKGVELDLNVHTIMYRALCGIDLDTAIDMSVEEKDKYGIGHNVDEKELVEIFYTIIREYIKEKES